MKIERPDPAVTVLQLMAREPARLPAVSQASVTQEAGFNAERQSQDSASNGLKARLSRLDKLREITDSAGKYLGVVMQTSTASTGGAAETARMAETASQVITEMLEDANQDGPPIFPPLPSPLARSRRTLKGYLGQAPKVDAPGPKTKEAEAVDSAEELLLGKEGVIATLKGIVEGADSGNEPLPLEKKLSSLQEKSREVSQRVSSALSEMKDRIEKNPSVWDSFDFAA